MPKARELSRLGSELRRTGQLELGGQVSLRTAANDILQQGGERLTVADKGVGSILPSMGFRSTKWTKSGWILWLNSATLERCHQLLKVHENRYVPDWDFAQHSTAGAVGDGGRLNLSKSRRARWESARCIWPCRIKTNPRTRLTGAPDSRIEDSG